MIIESTIPVQHIKRISFIDSFYVINRLRKTFQIHLLIKFS